ncbi:hypothetical protein GCM10011390_47130 [Aureimonas endophytica]|uniref:DUF1203 domain-containing protein n=1 Tax=Aureimonas endophytica TaxID=2027858 RepID=A0A917A3L3_9HYPH|nr:DUF1203 domain-containing protein [Aureimonas endophytica]GGE22340.1 hypothetical protein GCM10011390_47130 [Aureimonas endophytica]
MPAIKYQPLLTELVQSLRSGGLDAYGRQPERVSSVGQDNPCRHCLNFIPEGTGMLVLAHRPFPEPQPYAETGPIFLCEAACEPWKGQNLPPILGSSSDYLLKGYGPDFRIRYGTGRIVPTDLIPIYALELFTRDDISFVDVRSARNNCFHVRIVRDE